MAHGGTNFGYFSGANTGTDASDYKPDLTSYDYVSEAVEILSFLQIISLFLLC